MRSLGFTALPGLSAGPSGRITVLYFLRRPFNGHVDRADFFLPHIAIALFHPQLDANAIRPRRRRSSVSPRQRTRMYYLPIIVGATMRHSDAGLAITTLPLVFAASCRTGTPQIAVTLRIVSARS